MKKHLLLIALLPMIATAQIPCNEALIKYAERYPAAESQDLYKLVFQDLYGPGHLLTDSLAAVRYISKEVAEMKDTYPEDIRDINDGPFPLYEYTLCDSNFVRVNLLLVKRGVIPLDKLVSALLRSTEGLPTPDSKFVMTHSSAFKTAYDPHYRIIRRDIFDQEFRIEIGIYIIATPLQDPGQ